MREPDRKLAEYAAWLKESTAQRPQLRWTPIKIAFEPEEGWALTPQGIDETFSECEERANREIRS